MNIVNAVPYGPDIKRLQEQWPVEALVEGLIIPHEELETALHCERHKSRFYTVIRAWCKRESREHDIFMAWEPKVGLKVLDPSRKLSHGNGKLHSGRKMMGRGFRVVSSVSKDRDRLDQVEQKLLDHITHFAAVIKNAFDDERKRLAVDLAPMKSLPKRPA